MVLAILPLVLGITFIIVFLGKEKFGYSVPVSIILSSFFLYFSQILFSTFSVGLFTFVLTGLSGCLMVAVSLLRANRSSRFKDTLILFFSPGFYAFLVVFFFALIAYGGRFFSAWDELSHWGPMVKEMIRLDNFYIVPETRYMAHKDYPPIIQLFEYLICRFAGGYSEGNASTGIQLVLLSFVVPPLMEKIEDNKSSSFRKKVGANLLLGLLMLVMTVLLFLWFDVSDVYRTIMNDCAACAVGVYTLNISLDEDIITNKTKKVFLILALFYLPLCKQIALTFVLLVYMAIALALVQGKVHKSNNKLSNILFASAVIVVPLLSLKIWAWIIKPYNLGAKFDLTKISLAEVTRIIAGKGSSQQRTTYKNFVASLLSEPITTGPIALSYVSLCVLALFLLSLLYFYKSSNYERISLKEYIKYILVFVAGIIGYAFTMFVMYMYGFSEIEMLGLASFSRYMSTYICLMYFLLLSLFLSRLDLRTDTNDKSLNKNLIIAGLTVLLFILAGQERLVDFMPILYGNETKEFQELASDIDNHVAFDDKVLLISDNNNMYGTFLRYYCDDADLSGEDYWNGVSNEDLVTYDYVYVLNISDYQNEEWRQVLECPSDTISQGMYEVINDDDIYKLRYID